ncbi:MAG: HAD family hydrolase [Pseudomonadota bacterium]
MSEITTIGFDADDTLWHNEQVFQLTEDRFTALLKDHGAPDVVRARLLDAERRNLQLYGYGVKGFTLSMIETAIEVSDGKVDTAAIAQILTAGRAMLDHPVEVLPEVRKTLERLQGDFRLVLITKGDLFDQERKLAQSGLAAFFHGIEIVSEKTEATYDTVFARHGHGPTRALMVGNSLKSDILPALAAGSFAVHVPYPLTWAMEHADPSHEHPRFCAIDTLGELPSLLGTLQTRH